MPAKDYTRVTLYLTPQEKEVLERKANQAGLKISSYIKNIILGDEQMTTKHVNIEATIQDAREQLKSVTNTLMVNEPFDSVMTSYPKSGERIQNAINNLKTVDLRDKYGQAGRTILNNQIQLLEDIDLDDHSESILSILSDIVESLSHLMRGIRLKDTGQTMHDTK